MRRLAERRKNSNLKNKKSEKAAGADSIGEADRV